MREKLRIGILLNDYSMPFWKYKILEDLSHYDFVEFVVVIKNILAELSGLNHNDISIAVLRLLEKSDRALFKSKIDYNQTMDCSGMLRGVPSILIENNKTGENIFKSHVDKIKEYNLDIILKFGYHDLNGTILKITRYGIWSNSINEDLPVNKICHGFWEVLDKKVVTSSSLLVLDESRGIKDVVFSSMESTCPYSMEVNRHHLFWRASLFMPRIILGLHKFGDDYFERQKNKFKSIEYINTEPEQSVNTGSAFSAVFNYLITALKTALRKLFYTDAFNWQLLYEYKNGSENLLPDFSRFRKLAPPEGVFWADPFVVADNDDYYFFVEEFIYKKDKAHISVLKVQNDVSVAGSARIIERSYHMSYPFIFKIDSTYFMIPETCKNRTIELYKCEEFPYKWRFEKNLMENLLAVDTTIFYHDKKWWLFTSIDQTGNISGTSTELFLFFSDDFLSGNWISHPQNPVVSDVRKGRSAGKVFYSGTKIYRPSQDCSGRYGRGFKLNEIIKLTENEYYEKIVFEVEPVWDEKLRGTHTYNSDKELTVVDVYSYRNRLSF